MNRLMYWITAFYFLMLFSGCAVISQDLREKADPLLSPEQVRVNPDFYAGETVIWGGHILENQASQEETRLVILQTPLSMNQKPRSRETTQGRFIAIDHKYLDPAVFSVGRLVTVAGRLAESAQTLKNDGYGAYPVLQIQEIHLWKPAYGNRGYRPYYDPYPWYDDHPYFYGPSFHLLFGI